MLKLLLLCVALFAVNCEDELLMVQLLYRHGAKIPDIIDPYFQELWSPWMPPLKPGYHSPQGELEMHTLGSLLRKRYIEEIPLLSEAFRFNELQVRASGLSSRPLMSSSAMLSTFYPNSVVPVYNEPPERDTVLNSIFNCPSYVAEFDERYDRLNRQWRSLYPELIGNISEHSGWVKDRLEINRCFVPYTCPDDFCFGDDPDCTVWFIWQFAEELQCMINTGFLDYVDPNIRHFAETLLGLWAQLDRELYGMHSLDDRKGPVMAQLAREFLDNFQTRIDDPDSVPRMFVYSIHGVHINLFADALNLGAKEGSLGSALNFELWREEGTNELYTRAEYLRPINGGEEYHSESQPILCPTGQEVCSFGDFSAYVARRNTHGGLDEQKKFLESPPANPPQVHPLRGDGCCVVGAAFFDKGCGDYLNPDVLRIPECVLYRQWCPHVACDENQVVDSATLLCVPTDQV